MLGGVYSADNSSFLLRVSYSRAIRFAAFEGNVKDVVDENAIHEDRGCPSPKILAQRSKSFERCIYECVEERSAVYFESGSGILINCLPNSRASTEYAPGPRAA